jgi:squalene-hopene/tetraprenyl-beta-curcumene cyclase
MPLSAQRVWSALRAARAALLRERTAVGFWEGRLSSSALSTATAVSALSAVRSAQHNEYHGPPFDATAREHSDALIARGVAWLAHAQNPDGGWGDTDRSPSNISTTMLVCAAFRLAGAAEAHAAQLDRAENYVAAQGGIHSLRRRYGKDKTFAVPILLNCALAGMVPWHEVDPLPFELACVPQRAFRFLRLPVVSYALPALVAIGQARCFHAPPRNLLMRLVRRWAVGRSMELVQRMQPASGGFLEATPLTSFVVMSLASTGRAGHEVTRRGVAFLLDTVRDDGSWPIDTNLATWNTTLAINALATSPPDVNAPASGDDASGSPAFSPASAADFSPPQPLPSWLTDELLDWLLSCQHLQVHPYTGAKPGGWAWTDLAGGVPDADDTAGALLALAAWRNLAAGGTTAAAKRLNLAVEAGVRWLADLQNSDGGWPTFCRGWGTMPFDRSAPDLTAHALRAISAWSAGLAPALQKRLKTATSRGLRFLARTQQPDGSWIPLWFGNAYQPGEANPVYGTAKVLMAYRDLRLVDTEEARRGFEWLKRNQNPDGGWGGGMLLSGDPAAPSSAGGRHIARQAIVSSVEETSLAVEALLSSKQESQVPSPCLQNGVEFLVQAVESNRLAEASPIGLYFAKLWYYEKLYPLVFALSALQQAAAWGSSWDLAGSRSHFRLPALDAPR